MNTPSHTYLFLFTIGPVQSFIAQARKTLDLKAGSDILSGLILAGMRHAQETYHAEIIFPHLPANHLPDSIPNKFLASVSVAEGDLAQIGKDVEAYVRESFSGRQAGSIGKDALKRMGLTQVAPSFQERFFEQLEAHLEVYWVMEPMAEGVDYATVYQKVEQSLAAIKNLRIFQQMPEREDGRKCSVSGSRDALIFSNHFKLPAFAYKNRVARINRSPVMIGSGEGLSAVTAVKRFYGKVGFKSSAEIAAGAFEAHLPGTQTWHLFELYKKQFDPSDWDGQLLFPENVTDRYLEQNLSIPHKASSTAALKRQLDKMRRKAQEEQLPGISSYYAILTFDGDRMGAIWSGDPSYLQDSRQLRAFQEALAERLYVFAGAARVYLDKGQKGQAVYAGGDDFMGLLNLEYLFEVLTYLRALYQEQVSDALKGYLKPDTSLSFSAGVCIGHYKNPLGEVLRSAHHAQEVAKEEGGRDALTICLMKRSGEIQQATMKWGLDQQCLNALQTCVALMQTGCFSNTYISVLNREIMGLIGRNASFEYTLDFSDMIRMEIKRLIHQARQDAQILAYHQESPEKKPADIIGQMEEVVWTLFQQDMPNQVENFLHWLEIADFLTRQPVTE